MDRDASELDREQRRRPCVPNRAALLERELDAMSTRYGIVLGNDVCVEVPLLVQTGC